MQFDVDGGRVWNVNIEKIHGREPDQELRDLEVVRRVQEVAEVVTGGVRVENVLETWLEGREGETQEFRDEEGAPEVVHRDCDLLEVRGTNVVPLIWGEVTRQGETLEAICN